MIQIKIKLDFNNGPIFGNYYDEDLHKVMTGVAVIDNNESIQKLNEEIMNMYSSYYEFNSNNQSCEFNLVKEKQNKEKMLTMLNKLIKKLNDLNDGSYEVIDLETERVKNL